MSEEICEHEFEIGPLRINYFDGSRLEYRICQKCRFQYPVKIEGTKPPSLWQRLWGKK